MPRKIEVVPYDPTWPESFRAEAARLRPIFADNLVEIHHMGSTSVPGLSAKPIIDLLVEVRDLGEVDAGNDRMIALGYMPEGEFGIAGRRYFPLVSADEVHVFHVHVYQNGNPEILRHLAVRDYLIVHPEAAKAYGCLKQDLADRHLWDAPGYQAAKAGFVDELERRALAWARSRVTS
jgi:GrpB-like predicted nucleotidyltransferase (UPF0157 family)